MFDELSREECEEIREQDGYQKGLSEGMERGLEKGMEQGIKALAELCKEMGMTREETRIQIMQKFSLSEKKVDDCIEQYWPD